MIDCRDHRADCTASAETLDDGDDIVGRAEFLNRKAVEDAYYDDLADHHNDLIALGVR